MLFNTQSLLALSLAGLISAPLVSAAPAQHFDNSIRAADSHLGKRDIVSDITSFDPTTAFSGAATTVDLIAQAKQYLDSYKDKITTALGTTDISEMSKLALKAELKALDAWFEHWADSAPSDVQTSLSQLQDKVTTFEDWAKKWCAATPGLTLPSDFKSLTSLIPTAVPTEIKSLTHLLPTGVPTDIKSLTHLLPTGLPTGIASHLSGILPTVSSTVPVSAPTGTYQGVPTYTGTGAPQHSVHIGTPKFPAHSANGSHHQPTGTGGVAHPTTYPISSTPTNGTTGPGVAVWWGNSPTNLPIAKVCADSSIDTVIISFLTNATTAGGYPKIAVGPLMNVGASPAQKKAGATNLLDGTSIVPDLKKCQKAGKKVMLSLGGQGADVTFKSDAGACDFADQLWSLFLGGTDAKLKPLRPFGDVILDGIDIDNESKEPQHYVAFVKQLRKNMKKSKTPSNFKISAAPQCPRLAPTMQDASIPDAVLKLTDYVWVQHYNNGDCNHGAPGFLKSVKTWSKAVAPAQLWIASPASTAGAGSGYISHTKMEAEVKAVKALKLKNFGGYALWDASLAMGNSNYQSVIGKALKGSK